jgi:hypothetical protein
MQDMMRWIVVFNPILVIFLMAVHKISGNPPMDPQNQLHVHQRLHHSNHVLHALNASGGNHT